LFVFYKAFDLANDPLRADRSALGYLPSAAFQYCEPVRQASSAGYYVFPPVDIRLRFDGKEIYIVENDVWVPLATEVLGADFEAKWNSVAPADMRGSWPAWMSPIPVVGGVQVWSGFFIKTLPGWSTLVRPPPNVFNRSSFSCFEGVVSTDEFSPCPLFINLVLHNSATEIFIAKDIPLFFVQPVSNEYKNSNFFNSSIVDFTDLKDDSSAWNGIRHTLRTSDPRSRESMIGRYGAKQRRSYYK
jgi:hypothetical protein